jgi:hypothetical protein
MGDRTHAAGGLRRNQCRPPCEQQQRRRVSVPLKVLVHRKLAEQRGRYRLRAVALLRLGQKRALDWRPVQRDRSADASPRDVGDDVHLRHAADLIVPGVPAEPGVERLPAAIEQTPLARLGQWPRWDNQRDRSGFPGRRPAREVHQCGNGCGLASDPCLKRVPVVWRNGDNGPAEYLGFGRFQRFAANELAEAGRRLFRRRFKDGAPGGSDPNAQDGTGG